MSWRSVMPVRWGGCPPPWQLSRALYEVGHRGTEIHVRVCRACAAEWRALSGVEVALREVPRPAMDRLTRQRIEGQLLGGGVAGLGPSLPRGRGAGAPRRRAAAALVIGATAAAAALVAWRGGAERERARDAGPSSASLVAIRAVGAAAFSRAQSASEEIVRLDSGTLEIELRAPSPTRRFRVATEDAVIDAPEGRFSVEAEAHMLVALRVFAGYAEVRAEGGHAVLRAGDEWVRRAAHAAEPAHEAPAKVAPAPAKLAEAPRRRELAAPPRSASFDRAWHLLQAGQPARAAEVFRELDARSGGDAISEDALFWQGVALSRARMPAAARDVLARFSARFPASERLGEASAMLGWLLLDAGDTDGARRAFERARNDKVDRVRASARSGLTRLAPGARVQDRDAAP